MPEASDGHLRLFLALDLPDETRAAVAQVIATGGAGLRAVPADSLHVTLVFLGATPAGDVGRIWASAVGAADGLPAPVLAPAGLVGIPQRRPRLLAVDLVEEGGRAAMVQAAVVAALTGAGLYTAEGRPFWPHVTVGRARRGSRVHVPDVRLSLGSFVARDLTLYRSRTGPGGARYTALERLRLRS